LRYHKVLLKNQGYWIQYLHNQLGVIPNDSSRQNSHSQKKEADFHRLPSVL